jgi:hypothetical protein
MTQSPGIDILFVPFHRPGETILETPPTRGASESVVVLLRIRRS